MDISSQIKDSLISRIQASDDLIFLKTLQTIFDSSEQSLFQLTKEQEESIAISREQIKAGKFKTNDQVISEMKEWLSKK
ncbi:MAG: hypothetical protein ACOVRN_19035 [Flavobacterium sp.]